MVLQVSVAYNLTPVPPGPMVTIEYKKSYLAKQMQPLGLHSTPLTGWAIKPQHQGHIVGPIAQPWWGRGGYVCMYAWCV